MSKLFDNSGGYRKLHSFTYATMIHLGTIRFCRRFVPYQKDPLGKTSGQMIGAARSGRQNIIEGSERSGTSKETEIKLTDVARASLAELLGDYETYLADQGVIPWSIHDPNHQALGDLFLPTFEYTNDTMHDYWVYFHEVRKPYSQWLDSDDDTVIANAMLVLIKQTMVMLAKQLENQGATFLENGGFRERMYQCRTEARDNTEAGEPVPPCPECGKPMRRRTAHTGRHQGEEFWGCSDYPSCRGTREIGPEQRIPDPATS